MLPMLEAQGALDNAADANEERIGDDNGDSRWVGSGRPAAAEAASPPAQTGRVTSDKMQKTMVVAVE